jgi:hypothetical protein
MLFPTPVECLSMPLTGVSQIQFVSLTDGVDLSNIRLDDHMEVLEAVAQAVHNGQEHIARGKYKTSQSIIAGSGYRHIECGRGNQGATYCAYRAIAYRAR